MSIQSADAGRRTRCVHLRPVRAERWTALNMFVRDMPRISVDIDVVFVEHTGGRGVALTQIANELASIKQRLDVAESS